MSKYTDPKYLIGLRNLYLAAKTTIDGFNTGMNKSRIKGTGSEFSQYRSYQPGDDLRWLDWKMFARSDRYYIRQSDMETQIGVSFLLDGSGSMAHEDEGLTKIEFGKYLIACLTYLSTMHGDAVGLALFKENAVNSIASKQSFQHLSRLLYQLEKADASGKFASPMEYKKFLGTAKRRELVVFVTDMYQQTKEIIQLIDMLVALGNEVIVFHLMAQNEMQLDFKGFSAMEDLETGEIVSVDVQTIRSNYKTKLKQHLAEIKKAMLERKVTYQLVNISDKVDEVIRNFLTQRAKL